MFAAKCIGKGAGADQPLLKKDVVRTLTDGGVWGGVKRKAISFRPTGWKLAQVRVQIRALFCP